MANLRIIKTKIKSVKSLKKITRALEIVSTVKLQKIKNKVETLRKFMEDFMRILNSVSNKINIFDNKPNPNGRRLIIVVTSERGLCGSINSKLMKHIHGKYEDYKDNTDIFCIGKKGLEFFSRSKFNVVGSVHLKENFEEKDLSVVYSFLKRAIQQNEYAKIKVYFNYFKNTITQIPLRFKIYPLDKDSFEKFVEQIDIRLDDHIDESALHKDLVVEPDLAYLKNELINQLAQHIIFGAVLQNKAGEHASRMIAMKNATDNSSDMINSLTLTFNKARQSNITQEISEIVSAKIAIEK